MWQSKSSTMQYASPNGRSQLFRSFTHVVGSMNSGTSSIGRCSKDASTAEKQLPCRPLAGSCSTVCFVGGILLLFPWFRLTHSPSFVRDRCFLFVSRQYTSGNNFVL